MSLKDLIKKVHRVDLSVGPESLSDAIDIYLSTRPEGSGLTDEEREEGWHPSQFCGMCARAWVYQQLLKVEEPEFKIDPRLQKIFDIGTDLHSRYQNDYLRAVPLWGKWECRNCGDIYWGLRPMDEGCSFMHGSKHEWRYKEVPVRWHHPEFMDIVGHSDGLIQLAGVWWVLEMKSINDRGFRARYAPKQEHEDQGVVYTELIRNGCIDGLPAGVDVPKPEGLLVLYIGKNTSEEKEFKIERNPEYAKESLSQPWKAEKAMKERVLPSRLDACKNVLSKRSKACGMSKYCFDEGTWTWKKLMIEGNKK
jgi:hypothetical protein